MKIKRASDDLQNMAQSGDSILRSLQNTDFSLSDLIVRESIQNALDASKKGSKSTKVDYTLRSFEASQLIPHFEGIEDTLNKNYRGLQDFLAISDRNTVGLTGDYYSDNSEGNFQKLVFSIGKNQEADGAGGSWGMGKTSYFRVGAGLVIYYTRIQTDEGYEERLIASLIESPKKAHRLLKDSTRGIAWWGRYEDDSNHLLPITDHEDIKKFMNIFGLDTYKDDETGTTIIIPFLEKSLSNRLPNEKFLPWEQDRVDSLKMAVKRWYAPRLINDKYPGSALICRINGELIGFTMEPTFTLMKALYTSALTGKSHSKNIEVKPIFLARQAMANTKEPVGYVAFILPEVDELKMTSPNNLPSPTAYITSNPDDTDVVQKIVAFARKPGMVVKYDINGSWSQGVSIADRNLLAFFVPNSQGKLYSKLQEKGFKTLEQYLRKGEKADHADWFDQSDVRPNIISRIIREVKDTLANEINNSGKDVTTHTSERLARRFGKILLPSPGFGKASSLEHPKESHSKNKTSRNRKVDLSITGTEFVSDGRIRISFTTFLKGDAIISPRILTQDGNMGIEKWHKTFGALPFPVIIEGFSWDKDNYDFKYQVNSGQSVVIENSAPLTANGTLTLKLLSAEYQPILAIRQVKE